jgi:hypothetical protein
MAENIEKLACAVDFSSGKEYCSAASGWMLAITEKRRNLDALPTGASSGR